MSDADPTHDPVLRVRDLTTAFLTRRGKLVAVDGVNLDVPVGKTLGIVGESGSGKSVTSLSVMGLLPRRISRVERGSARLRGVGDLVNRSRYLADSTRTMAKLKAQKAALGEAAEGSTQADTAAALDERIAECQDDLEILKLGHLPAAIDVLRLRERDMREIRGAKVSMIFQEPMTSLNPSFTVGFQLKETIRLHQGLKGKALTERAIEAMQSVRIPAPEKRIHDFPHQLSGGMRQRVMIALAIACEPELLIADEPTTALDVTIQAQILELLKDLQESRGMAMILITHNMGVIAEAADDVAVMYAGQVVEQGPTRDVLRQPAHPYTQGLLKSIPRKDESHGHLERLSTIPGVVPDLISPPPGCRFEARCAHAHEACSNEPPVKQLAGERISRCWIAESVQEMKEAKVNE